MRKRAFRFVAGILCGYAGLGALLHLDLLPEAAPDAQRGAHFLVAPTVRLLGYRSWYPEYTEEWRIDRIGARNGRRR